MSEAMVFTTRGLDALKPRAKAYDVREFAGDGRRGSGLRVRVAPSGVKSFRWFANRTTYTLGQFGDGTRGTLTLAMARERLEKHKARLKAGLEPDGAGDGRPRTVAQLARLFYEQRLKNQRRHPELAWATIESKILPVIGHLPLNVVETVDTRRPTEKCVKDGYPGRARAVLQLTKQIFNFAAANGFVPISPAGALDAKEMDVVANDRDRFMTAEEIPVVRSAIARSGMVPVMKLAFDFLLFTGLRRNEALTLEWTDVDLAAATVSVRPENQKISMATLRNTDKAKPYVVPLSPQAQGIVRLLRDIAPADCKWVFYSPLSESGRIQTVALSSAMARLWKPKPAPGLEGMEQVKPHDYRRTLATHVSGTLGYPPYLAQLLLGHSLNRVVGSNVASVYDQATRLKERREALDAYGAWVESLSARTVPADAELAAAETAAG